MYGFLEDNSSGCVITDNGIQAEYYKQNGYSLDRKLNYTWMPHAGGSRALAHLEVGYALCTNSPTLTLPLLNRCVKNYVYVQIVHTSTHKIPTVFSGKRRFIMYSRVR